MGKTGPFSTAKAGFPPGIFPPPVESCGILPRCFWRFIYFFPGFPPFSTQFSTLSTGFSTVSPWKRGWNVWKTLLKLWKTGWKTGETPRNCSSIVQNRVEIFHSSPPRQQKTARPKGYRRWKKRFCRQKRGRFPPRGVENSPERPPSRYL